MDPAKKRVVSLSMFRHGSSDYETPEIGEWRGQFYVRHLPAILRGYAVCYPGWEVRIHHDESLYSSPYADTLLRLDKAGMIRLAFMGRARTLGMGSLWRFAPLEDPNVDLFVTRDLDSMPTPRERALVEEWIRSGKTIGCIHDSTSHHGLMTGMIGVRAERFVVKMKRSAANFLHDIGELAHGLDMNVKENDQVVLNRYVLPEFVDDSIFHQLNGCTKQPGHETSWVSKTFQGTIPEWADERRISDYERVLLEGMNLLAPHIGAPFDFDKARRWYNNAFTGKHPGVDAIYAAERKSAWKGEDGEPFVFQNPGNFGRRVVLSTDLSTTYAFFAPITAAIWRHLGFRPMLMALSQDGSGSDWMGDPIGRMVIEHAVYAGAEIRFVPKIPGFLDSTIAQFSRVFGAMFADVRETDYVLTADVDMIPCPKMPGFLAQGNPDAEAHLFYSNAYEHESEPHWPMCYIGAPARVWRKWLGTPTYRVHWVDFGMREILERDLGARETWDSKDSWTAWNFDEKWISAQIAKDREWFAAHVQRIFRDPQRDRVDRAWWDKCPPASECVDCHALRPGFADENWPKILPVIAAASSPGWAEQFDGYRRKFVDRWRLVDSVVRDAG